MRLAVAPNILHSLALIITLCFTWVSMAWAEIEYPEKMIFRNIMSDQDIGLGEVEAFVQDADGFMWFGGRNGLLRFDGYEFLQVSIEPDPNDASKPTEVSQTVDLFVDSRKILWVATRSGLYQYSPELEQLKRLRSDDPSVDFDLGDFNRIIELPNGHMLAATYDGVIDINVSTMELQRIRKTGDNKGPLATSIQDLFLAKSGMVWMGGNGGVSRMDPATKEFEHFVVFSENPSATKENAIQAMEEDKNGHIWAGASWGLYRIEPDNKKIHRYLNNPDQLNSLSDSILEDLFLDSEGILWVGTDRGGLNYYRYDSDDFRAFKNNEGVKGSLSSNITRRIYEDKNQDLWVGTYPSGINFHDRSSSAVSVYKHEAGNINSLPANLVTSIQEDLQGNFWIGTDGGGPVWLDRNSGEMKTYPKGIGEQGKILSDKMLCGLVDSDGDVWFGTWDAGIFVYNKKQDRFDQLPLDTSQAGGKPIKSVLTDTSIWDIYEDSQHTIWFATHNRGLVRYDKVAKTFRYFQENPGDPSTLSKSLIWTVHEDAKGRFWVGTVGGLNLMDREAETFTRFVADPSIEGSLKNDFITSIFDDAQGRLWVGTNNGLHLFDESNNSFKVFNNSNGFVDNGIRAIEQDSKGNLWLGTNNGITQFNPDTLEVKNFRRFNGDKIGGISTGGSLKTSREEIVFGGPNGMRIYNVENLAENLNPPPVALTEFRIFTKPVEINGDGGFLNKALNRSESITLSYKESMVSFNYAALNFRDTDKNQYAYKLEGFDNDWREVGSLRQALYTNLSAGNYIFRVKASNNDGVWNEQGASIKLKQLPPPWLTWWAKLLYALAVIAVIARFIQQQHKKRKAIEEQNRILEQRVAERTSELRAKNDDIQAMLSNMRQGLFTIESNGQIHPEYSKHLESIFEREQLASCEAYELLFGRAQLGSNELNQVKEGIFAIIGEDEMNFEFNSHVLINEYDVEINGQNKCLSLDWNPIVDAQDVVTKLMVSVRDVSLLKQMESEAASKKRELDIISQLLNLPANKYRKFIESSQQFLDRNQKLIQSHSTKDDGVLAELFRNMHTIKGNCRTFGFTHFSDVVHEVETRYAEFKQNPEKQWFVSELIEDVQAVRYVLAEYEHVFTSVLGRDSKDKGRGNGLWLSEDALKQICADIDASLTQFPALAEKGSLARVQATCEQGLSAELPGVLADVIDSLPSIAHQLQKPEPKVEINAGGLRFYNEFHDTLNNVFAHLLRNCLDHGIEAPDQREQAGKSAEGNIQIQAQVEEGSAQPSAILRISDDGRGLNLSKLYELGIKNQVIQAEQALSLSQVCELVFASGLSTKEAVTDLSGRGVGMDAVRQFIRDLGGDVKIELLNEKDSSYVEGQHHYVHVAFVILLPAKLWMRIKA